MTNRGPQPLVSYREARRDPRLLGNLMPGDSWQPWDALLLAALGEALTAPERAIFKTFTQRDHEPGHLVEEFVAVKGRRAGGSYSAGVLATYLGGLCEHPALVRGERGIILICAADTRQSTVILDYVEADFAQSPVLAQLVEQRTQTTLRLTNNIDIEVRAADFRRLRGLTFVAAIADELAFWMTGDEYANPDSEILAAIRPGLATTGGPLFVISSPYGRKGELWELYRKHFGKNGDPAILVAQGSSREFNSTLPQSLIDRAIERDPASADAEYLGRFRIDLEQFVIREVVQGCTPKGVYERPYDRNHFYIAFIDPSGGSADSFTLCIAHFDYARSTVIIDVIREQKPPFSPEATVEEFAKAAQLSDQCRPWRSFWWHLANRAFWSARHFV